jgi:hypothetical protein
LAATIFGEQVNIILLHSFFVNVKHNYFAPFFAFSFLVNS